MKRHLPLVLLRMLLAIGVAVALPYSHEKWGETYPGDGQQAFGFIIIFAAIGVGAAALFLLFGSVAHYHLRRKRVRMTLFTDLALFILFAGLLVYGGVTAKYSDAKPSPPASRYERMETSRT